MKEDDNAEDPSVDADGPPTDTETDTNEDRRRDRSDDAEVDSPAPDPGTGSAIASARPGFDISALAVPQTSADAAEDPPFLCDPDQRELRSVRRILQGDGVGALAAAAASGANAGAFGMLGVGNSEASRLAALYARQSLAANAGLLGGLAGQRLADRFRAGEQGKLQKLAEAAGSLDRASMVAWAKPLGGFDVGRWAQPRRYGEGQSAIDRALRWANGVEAGPFPGHAVAKDAQRPLFDQAIAVSRAAERMLRDAGRMNPPSSSFIDALISRRSDFAPTANKLSMFAGALDVVGPGVASSSAFDSLLGKWRTRDDLPAAFWRDSAQRSRFYREADVDAGLIEAESAELIELLVDTGVAEGETRNGRVTAIIDAGPLQVRVSASRPRQGATRMMSALELGLRGFVEMKLRAAVAEAGQDPNTWFKARIPGDVVKRARERRHAARVAGEKPADMIAFVDLGDFIPIVMQSENWKLFQPVFGSQTGFRADLERLNAIRRPIAHMRPIDPVQLAETTMIVARLTKSMTLDGGWEGDWDDED